MTSFQDSYCIFWAQGMGHKVAVYGMHIATDTIPFPPSGPVVNWDSEADGGSWNGASWQELHLLTNTN